MKTITTTEAFVPVRSITVSVAKTINLGNYESKKIQVGMSQNQ